MNENLFKALSEADSTCSVMGMRKEYVHVAGDLAAGSLLSQIVYWHLPAKNGKSKLRVPIEGHLYVAKTSKDWMDECCLSESQVKRAIQVLKRKGLIEVRLKKFNGSPQNHYRLLSDRLLTELKAHSTVQKELDQFGEKHLSGSALLPSLDSVESHETLTENTAEITTKNILCAGSTSSAEGNVKSIKEVEQGKETGKAFTNDLWKELIWKFHQGLMKPWKSKQWGQYKQLCSSLGPNSDKILTHALSGWTTFAWSVQHSTGVSVIPHSPDVGFLLQYAYLAQHSWTAEQESKLANEQKHAKYCYAVPLGAQSDVEEMPDKASPEQVAELLAMLSTK